MSKKSPQDFGEQTLNAYQADGGYLMLRTRQQLQLIRVVAVHQIAKKAPRADQYQGLLVNAGNLIVFRQQKTKREDTLADKYIQVRKAASEITRTQLMWTTFVSVFMGGILTYIKGSDSGG